VKPKNATFFPDKSGTVYLSSEFIHECLTINPASPNTSPILIDVDVSSVSRTTKIDDLDIMAILRLCNDIRAGL